MNTFAQFAQNQSFILNQFDSEGFIAVKNEKSSLNSVKMSEEFKIYNFRFITFFIEGFPNKAKPC